jgi:glycosyltransferase involved in cell wall biosynthesis
MKSVKVSVSLITYNHEKYIAECLDSIVNQVVDFDFEIIVADDCSKDRTPEIVADYASRYPDLIKPILRKTNLGLVGNAISTIEACSAPYIALMEGDDFWVDEHKLQIQSDYLDKNLDCALCFTNNYTFYEDKPGYKRTFFSDKNRPPEKFDLDFFVNNNVTIPNNTKMFRREVQPKNFPDWYYHAVSWDWMLHIMQASHGNIGYIDRITLAYRRHNEAAMFENSINILLNSITITPFINKYLGYKYNQRFKNLWWEYHEVAFEYFKSGSFLKSFIYYTKYVFSIRKLQHITLRDDLWRIRTTLFQKNK